MKQFLVAALVPLGLAVGIAVAADPATVVSKHRHALFVAQADVTMIHAEQVKGAMVVTRIEAAN